MGSIYCKTSQEYLFNLKWDDSDKHDCLSSSSDEEDGTEIRNYFHNPENSDINEKKYKYYHPLPVIKSMDESYISFINHEYKINWNLIKKDLERSENHVIIFYLIGSFQVILL